MAKAAIVFHTVCGNTYQMALYFQQMLKDNGIQTDLFRVEDETFEELSLRFAASREFRDAIMAIPVIHSGDEIIGYDALFLGSPTYFGGVSAQMKRFMDTFCDLWVEAKLAGTAFGCFAAGSTSSGGAEMCLQSMNIFAQHMGMRLISVPCNLKGTSQPAYGIVHFSGATSEIRLDEDEKTALDSYAAFASKMI